MVEGSFFFTCSFFFYCHFFGLLLLSFLLLFLPLGPCWVLGF